MYTALSIVLFPKLDGSQKRFHVNLKQKMQSVNFFCPSKEMALQRPFANF